MARIDRPRIAIIGAGPIGLEAALYAKKLDLPVVVFEAGQVGESLWQWGHVRMFSPFGWNSTSLGRNALLREKPAGDLPDGNAILTGHQLLESYLLPLAATEPLRDVVRLGTRVLHVGRIGFSRDQPANDPKRAASPFRLLVGNEQGESDELADVVLDCSGVYGQPRWMGDGGIPAKGEMHASEAIVYGVDDILDGQRNQYAGRSVLVVGGGYSAATSIRDLATIANDNQATWIIWLVRGPRSQPIPRVPSDPLRERDRLAVAVNTLATRGEGNVEYHAQAIVESIQWHGPDKGFAIGAKVVGKRTSWEVERVIANVGFKPDLALCAELHITESSSGTWRTAEPNYFVLGTKSHGRDSRFLLRSGFDQVREVFAHLTGKPSLDLYA